MQELLLAMTARNRCTVLLVTHDIREAILLSNRVLVLSARPGRILGAVDSTLPTPRSRKLYGTSEFELLYSLVSDRWPEQPSEAEARR